VKVLHHSARVDAVGTAVVVVHDPPQLLGRTMLRDLQIPYPVLIDRELDAYRRWGLGRAGRARTLLSPQVLEGYAKFLLRGERLGGGSQPWQLGGDFVIAADGRVAYSHPQRSVDDRPAVGLLVRELERA